jgi:excisionase family DNA binding protein
MGATSDQPRTVAQAAAELNLSKGTIRLWITQRRIGHIRLGGAIRIPVREIRRLLEAGYVPPEPRTGP